MNNYLVVYIEIDVTYSINNEIFMQGFQNIKTRRRKYYKFYIFVCFFFIFLLLSIYEFFFLLDCIIYVS